MNETGIKVNLIAHTENPEAVVAAAINQCYSNKTGKELFETMPDDKRARLIKQVIASGHTSTIEHAAFTFSIENVSRVVEIHLIRHRIASYSIKSGRYNKSHSNYVIPPKIAKNKEALALANELKEKTDEIIAKLTELGMASEDIRYLTPQGTKTNIVMTMNARSLFNFFKERLCERTMWETREVAKLMLKECVKVAPNIFKFAGPSCVTEKICWQGNLHCGKPDKIKSIEMRERYQ